MSLLKKTVIGALGGLAAVCVKFLGQDYLFVVDNAANLDPDTITSMVVGYGILTPILMFLGGLCGALCDETSPLKVLAIGIAAPAMITTYAGGTKTEEDSKTDLNSFNLKIIGTAFAEEEPSSTVIKEKTVIDKVTDGVKFFFGYGKKIKQYWVIVGSYTDEKEAEKFANLINQKDKSLKAFVGLKIPPNKYYPVIVGGYSGYLPYSTAEQLRQKALELDIINDAYLSPGAKRIPE